MRIDLHTHSSVSDGTDTPAELVRKARDAGLDVVALTDHDTFDGLDEAVADGRAGRCRRWSAAWSCPVRGVGSSVHLLAYGADPASPGLAAEMARVRGGRMGRLAGVLDKLAELGVPVTEAQVLARSATARRWAGRTSPTPWSRPVTSATGRRPSTDSWPTAARPTCSGTPSSSSAASTWCTQAGGVAVIAHPWGRGREPSCRRRCSRRWPMIMAWTGSRWITKITTRRPVRRLRDACRASSACWPPAPATITAPARSITILAATPPRRRCSPR